MWIKIIFIEYILWGVSTIESTFDIANMVKIATVKGVPTNNEVFQSIFLMKIFLFWLKFHWSLPKGPDDDKPALVQIMAWRRTDDTPLSEPMMA